MKYELTIFKNQFDNKTHKKVSYQSWDKFVDLLYKLSEQKGRKGGKHSSVLITPAIFKTDSTRSNTNTLYWGGWCAVDVDDHNFGTDIHSLEQKLSDKLGEIDYVVYSTASSRSDNLKFRIVFRLDSQIEKEKIKAFWYALNSELGDIGDPQTKDLSRMYYVPADYPNAYGFIFHKTTGTPLNTSELISKHPYKEKTGNSFLDRLPPEMQKAVIEHRKNSLNNTEYTWTGYQDCPFFPKRMAMEYQTITGTGWYAKMYKIMIAIAGSAVKSGYPITATQISELCKEFDASTGNWYENRPLIVEADRALEYIYRKG